MRPLTGFIWLWTGTRNGHFDHGNEPLYYIQSGKFDHVKDYTLFKKVPQS
jgi:hypothetical protein